MFEFLFKGVWNGSVAKLTGIFNSGLIWEEWEILLRFWAHLLKDLDELVLLVKNSWFLAILISEAAWRNWEAACSWEHDSFLKLSESLFAIFVGEWKALSENAADAPHIWFRTVNSLGEDELWWSIPSWCNMWWQLAIHSLSEDSASVKKAWDWISLKSVLSLEVWWFLFVGKVSNFLEGIELLGLWPGKAEVAYLYRALVGEEDIAGFQVTVNDICGMKIVYCAE